MPERGVEGRDRGFVPERGIEGRDRVFVSESVGRCEGGTRFEGRGAAAEGKKIGFSPRKRADREENTPVSRLGTEPRVPYLNVPARPALARRHGGRLARSLSLLLRGGEELRTRNFSPRVAREQPRPAVPLARSVCTHASLERRARRLSLLLSSRCSRTMRGPYKGKRSARVAGASSAAVLEEEKEKVRGKSCFVRGMRRVCGDLTWREVGRRSERSQVRHRTWGIPSLPVSSPSRQRPCEPVSDAAAAGGRRGGRCGGRGGGWTSAVPCG